MATNAKRKLAEAVDFLQKLLDGGAVPAADIARAARAAAISARTLRRGKILAGVESFRDLRGWTWQLRKGRGREVSNAEAMRILQADEIIRMWEHSARARR